MKVSFISLAVLLSAGLAAAAPSGDPSKGENCNACAKCEYKNDDCGNQYGGSVICLFSSSLLPTSLTNNYLVTVVTTLAPATSTIPIRLPECKKGKGGKPSPSQTTQQTSQSQSTQQTSQPQSTQQTSQSQSTQQASSTQSSQSASPSQTNQPQQSCGNGLTEMCCNSISQQTFNLVPVNVGIDCVPINGK